MKSPEEEADRELGKKLREKFDGYKVPGKDRARKPIFEALDKSSNRLYWLPLMAAVFLIAVLLLFDLVKTPAGFSNKKFTVLHKNKTEHALKKQAKPYSQIEAGSVGKGILQQNHAPTGSKNNVLEFKNRQIVLKQDIQISDKPKTNTRPMLGAENLASIPHSKNVPEVDKENTGTDYTDVKSDYNVPASTKIDAAELALISPIDSVSISVSSDPLTIPSVSSKTVSEAVRKPAVTDGVRAVFSASVLQTFQLVTLSQSAEDRIQNLRFGKILSYKSLSYKMTAGIEKKYTQLLLSYTYLRNRNEYEIGTNQVIATRVGDHQYRMTIIGEKHLEDERSHLLGIGIRQRLKIPQNIVRNYSVNFGMDYTRLISTGQDLVWGSIGLFKSINTSAGTRFEIGPYFQYSFTKRDVIRQTWKSRPYQVGVSFGVKIN
jgi:hypothetical protein